MIWFNQKQGRKGWGNSSNIDKIWNYVQRANIDLNDTSKVLKLIACSTYCCRCADVVCMSTNTTDLFMHNFRSRTVLSLRWFQVVNYLTSTPKTMTKVKKKTLLRESIHDRKLLKITFKHIQALRAKTFYYLSSKISQLHRINLIRDGNPTIAAITKN